MHTPFFSLLDDMHVQLTLMFTVCLMVVILCNAIAIDDNVWVMVARIKWGNQKRKKVVISMHTSVPHWAVVPKTGTLLLHDRTKCNL